MGARVVLAVGGGIAAYKAPELVRALVGRGHEVRVLMTEAAGAFVSELALATVSRNPVRRRLLDPAEEGAVGHIEIADWADVVAVAPATANLLARARAGMADDIVTAVLLATRAPILWAPAMNTNMWQHPATRDNVAALAGRGDRFVGPDRGELACGWIGDGRMIDAPTIADGVDAVLVDRVGRWQGRHVLVSAGPTRAFLDPVRFVSNASTGEMGFALARAARERGARVTLVAGPVALPTPAGVARVDVQTAPELLAAMDRVLAAGDCDLVAMVAAVADVAPAHARPAKIPKAQVLGELGRAEWREEVDVLRTLAARYAERTRFLGFAAQTIEQDDPAVVEAELGALARAKLEGKGIHAVFANRVAAAGVGFGSPTNAGVLVLERAGAEPLVAASGAPRAKDALARWILEQLERSWPW